VNRSRLPHYDGMPLQSITFRMKDALPANLRRELAAQATPAELEAFGGPFYNDEVALDRGYGSCLLARTEAAEIVRDALFHWNNQRYGVIAWIIMPNHVHLVLRMYATTTLADTLHGLKTYTANALNRRLHRTGRFWQRNYWDRFIRDDEHLARCIDYIHRNSVSAGLVERPEDWEFSSASTGPDLSHLD